jgi:hypothetical protein
MPNGALGVIPDPFSSTEHGFSVTLTPENAGISTITQATSHDLTAAVRDPQSPTRPEQAPS